ncbi:transmembrane protein 130 [Hemitrygon akajei]|uniref:transmembrane protein 130 n=1 Tax=Hemitrygon akajei TaxID=2704970 RepID=UPI003BF94BFC
MNVVSLAFLLNAALPAGGSSLYNLVLSNDSPITTGAEGLVEARLTHRAGAQLVPRFHWDVPRPLSVVRRSEGELNSTLVVRSRAPGFYRLRAWVSRPECWRCPPLARGVTVLRVTDSVMGTVSLTQTNRSVTSLTNVYELATNTPTKISFILYDPSGYFNTASFRYSWHFGDGERAVTNDSSVFHVYPKAGVYQAHVDVLASLSHSRRKTGIFGATLSLLDPIKAIEIKSTDDKRTSDIHDFQLHINGSPPLQICWLLSQDCTPVVGHKCRPVHLEHSRNYNLSHSLASPGPYSLSVRAENNVSTFQTCYRVTSWQSGIHQVWFIVLSVTLFTVLLLVVLSTMVRNHRPRKNFVEVADFDFCPSKGKLVHEKRARPGKIASPCCGTGLTLGRESQSHGTREAHSLLRFSGSPPQDYRTWESCSAAPGTGRSPCYDNSAHLHSASGNTG